MCSYKCPTLKGYQVLQLVFELIVFILYLPSQNIFVLCKDLDLLQGLTHLQDKQKSNPVGATDLPIFSSWWFLVPVAMADLPRPSLPRVVSVGCPGPASPCSDGFLCSGGNATADTAEPLRRSREQAPLRHTMTWSAPALPAEEMSEIIHGHRRNHLTPFRERTGALGPPASYTCPASP